MDSETLWCHYGTVLERAHVCCVIYITPRSKLIRARLITLFLYMAAELSALQQIINALTGLNGLPVVIVECAVTSIYTSLGGFKISFITDNVQGAMVVGLIFIGVITVGVETKIQRRLIDE